MGIVYVFAVAVVIIGFLGIGSAIAENAYVCEFFTRAKDAVSDICQVALGVVMLPAWAIWSAWGALREWNPEGIGH